MKTINIAVWGLGRHALMRILPAIKLIDEISLVGVCSRNKSLVSDVSRNENCIGWTRSEEMLSNENVDVVYISTPIGVHFDHATKALKAGKNVWCEKPLTTNFSDTERLILLAKDKNKMLVEAFMFLYHPQFEKVRMYLQDKNNGKIHSLSCKFGIPRLENPGFRFNNKLGGGAFWDIASYPFAAVTSLFGFDKIKILYSEINKKNDLEVDSDGRVLLRFSSGVLAFLEWGMNISYRNEIDIWSEEGSLFTDKIFSKPDNYETKFQYRNLKGEEYFEIGEKSDQFINMFKDFYKISLSPVLISREYELILKRAKLLDEIYNYSKSNE